MRYQHTQRSMVWLVVFVVVEAIVLASLILTEVSWWAIGIVATFGGLGAVALTLFGRLNVEVDDSALTVAFGAGQPNKSVALSDIHGISAVRNKWWYGFGIRKIRRGWLWNVWGLDAVDLQLKDGRHFRVGTDDVDGLIEALRR